MSTPDFPIVGTVRTDRTLEELALEIDSLADKFQQGGPDSDAKALDFLNADYQATLAHRAALFQESVVQMQSLERPGTPALNPAHAKALSDGLSLGLLPLTPDHGFEKGVMPTDLMPSMDHNG